MPWCPKCKVEYQEGFSECSDCKSNLVESLEEAVVYVPFFQASDKSVADKLADFFEYSDLKCEVRYEETSDIYIVAIPPKAEKQAKKLYQAFYYVEAQRLNKEANSSEEDNAEETRSNTENDPTYEEDISASSSEDEEYDEDIPLDNNPAYDRKAESVYVMKADQYKDLSGSVWIFLVFGIAGIIFVILNITGILSILNGWITTTIMGILFLSFIYIAISTNKKAKSVQSEIDAENKLTDEINDWLKKNLTADFLSSIHDDNISEELNYIKMTDVIKEMLIKDFGTQNPSYLDYLIDEYYDNNIEAE